MTEWTLERALDRIQELEAELETRTSEAIQAAEMGEMLLKENEELQQELIDLRVDLAKAESNENHSQEGKKSTAEIRTSLTKIRESVSNNSATPSALALAARNRTKSILFADPGAIKSLYGNKNKDSDNSDSDSETDDSSSESENEVPASPSTDAPRTRGSMSSGALEANSKKKKVQALEKDLHAAVEALEHAEETFETEKKELREKVKSLQVSIAATSEQTEAALRELGVCKDTLSNVEDALDHLRDEVSAAKGVLRDSLSAVGVTPPPINAHADNPVEFRELVRLTTRGLIEQKAKAVDLEASLSDVNRGKNTSEQSASTSRALLEQVATEAAEELAKKEAHCESLELQLAESQKLLAAEHERLLNARRRLVYIAGKAGQDTDPTLQVELATLAGETLEDPSEVHEMLENTRRALEVAEAQSDVLNSQLLEMQEEHSLLRSRLTEVDPEFRARGSELLKQQADMNRKKSIRFTSGALLNSLRNKVGDSERADAVSLLQQIGKKMNRSCDSDSNSDSDSDSDSDSESSEEFNANDGHSDDENDVESAVQRTKDAFESLNKELRDAQKKLESAQKETKAFRILWADSASTIDELKQRLRLLEKQLDNERHAASEAQKKIEELSAHMGKKGMLSRWMDKIKKKFESAPGEATSRASHRVAEVHAEGGFVREVPLSSRTGLTALALLERDLARKGMDVTSGTPRGGSVVSSTPRGQLPLAPAIGHNASPRVVGDGSGHSRPAKVPALSLAAVNASAPPSQSSPPVKVSPGGLGAAFASLGSSSSNNGSAIMSAEDFLGALPAFPMASPRGSENEDPADAASSLASPRSSSYSHSMDTSVTQPGRTSNARHTVSEQPASASVVAPAVASAAIAVQKMGGWIGGFFKKEQSSPVAVEEVSSDTIVDSRKSTAAGASERKSTAAGASERKSTAAGASERKSTAAGGPERKSTAAGGPERKSTAAGASERKSTAAGGPERKSTAAGIAEGGRSLFANLLDITAIPLLKPKQVEVRVVFDTQKAELVNMQRRARFADDVVDDESDTESLADETEEARAERLRRLAIKDQRAAEKARRTAEQKLKEDIRRREQEEEEEVESVLDAEMHLLERKVSNKALPAHLQIADELEIEGLAVLSVNVDLRGYDSASEDEEEAARMIRCMTLRYNHLVRSKAKTEKLKILRAKKAALAARQAANEAKERLEVASDADRAALKLSANRLSKEAEQAEVDANKMDGKQKQVFRARATSRFIGAAAAVLAANLVASGVSSAAKGRSTQFTARKTARLGEMSSIAAFLADGETDVLMQGGGIPSPSDTDSDSDSDSDSGSSSSSSEDEEEVEIRTLSASTLHRKSVGLALAKAGRVVLGDSDDEYMADKDRALARLNPGGSAAADGRRKSLFPVAAAPSGAPPGGNRRATIFMSDRLKLSKAPRESIPTSETSESDFA